MNIIPNTKVKLPVGSVTLKSLATLDHNEWHRKCIQLADDNVLMYMVGDKSSKVMALVVGDERLMVGEDAEVLTATGYTRAHRLLLEDMIPGKLPVDKPITEMRRVVGSVLTYSIYTTKGYIELDSGAKIKTMSPLDVIPGAQELLNEFTGVSNAVKKTESTDTITHNGSA